MILPFLSPTAAYKDSVAHTYDTPPFMALPLIVLASGGIFMFSGHLSLLMRPNEPGGASKPPGYQEATRLAILGCRSQHLMLLTVRSCVATHVLFSQAGIHTHRLTAARPCADHVRYSRLSPTLLGRPRPRRNWRRTARLRARCCSQM